MLANRSVLHRNRNKTLWFLKLRKELKTTHVHLKYINSSVFWRASYFVSTWCSTKKSFMSCVILFSNTTASYQFTNFWIKYLVFRRRDGTSAGDPHTVLQDFKKIIDLRSDCGLKTKKRGISVLSDAPSS